VISMPRKKLEAEVKNRRDNWEPKEFQVDEELSKGIAELIAKYGNLDKVKKELKKLQEV